MSWIELITTPGFFSTTPRWWCSVSPMPMFHANGWTYTWIVTAAAALHVCLRQVDAASIYRLVNQERITMLCAAPTVLNDCGLLTGKRYTAHFSVADELPAILATERVVTDGKITTSRGAGTALEFGLHLVTLLTSPAQAEEISKAICL